MQPIKPGRSCHATDATAKFLKDCLESDDSTGTMKIEKQEQSFESESHPQTKPLFGMFENLYKY